MMLVKVVGDDRWFFVVFFTYVTVYNQGIVKLDIICTSNFSIL